LSASDRATGGDNLDRETQAPMVWLNLHTAGPPFGAGAAASFASLGNGNDGAMFDELATVFEHAPVEAFEHRADVDAASVVMEQLGAEQKLLPSNAIHSFEPVRHHASVSCDRDFAQPCPQQFQAVDGNMCAPIEGYQGPCGGTHSFEALSITAKGRWSEICLAWWPCLGCEHDFAAVCPTGWVLETEARCKPTAAYAGSCAAVVDFAGYTRDMFAQWSSSCDAHWPCSGSSVAHSVPASFLGGAAKDAGQFTISLIPPSQDARDSIARIDDVMMSERVRQVAANDLFAKQTQQALNAEKFELASLAQEAMH